MRKTVLMAALLVAFGAALAKIPAPVLTDEEKAKAAEAAAKTAWQAKVDAWLMCKAQDRVAAVYLKSAGKGTNDSASKETAKMTKTGAAPAAPAAPASVAKPAASGAAAAPASAAASGTTPVAWAPPSPCADPGPFAYNAPAEKPLETSGAHSPAGNATSPPSVRQESAAIHSTGKK